MLGRVPTLVNDPPPTEFQALLEQRRKHGLDHRDEVWEGLYRMNPPPSIEHQMIAQQLSDLLAPLARAAQLVPVIQEFAVGEPNDYVVPDGGLHQAGVRGVWHPTAALVIEIVSPGDESWEKLDFYAARHVDEVLIVEPQQRRVHWLGLDRAGGYRPLERSALIALGPGELASRLDWPQ